MKKTIFALTGLMAVLSFASQAEMNRTTQPSSTTTIQQQNKHDTEQPFKTDILNIDPRITNN